MDSKNTSKPVGVIGAGSFGTAIANILAENSDVVLFARKQEAIDEMHNLRISNGQTLHHKVTPSNDLEYVASNCDIIFPIVPSSNFREAIKDLSPFLHPYHILIHGTKGMDISLPNNSSIEDDDLILNRENVRTMSEIIRDESVVVRVGCLAGPNLAKELADNQPAATVVASHFDEVIEEGKRLLRNDRFQVYGNSDLIGVELCGVLKNIIAIASGALSGMGLGENARALLVSRGMVEMIYLGRALGGNIESFIGLAGVGDLVATCSSTLSRNFTVGSRLAKGEKLEEIMRSMEETAEGINTTRIVKKLADNYKVRAPITQMLHKVLFEDLTVEDALQYLMKYPLNVDIDFL
ncbi:NAD(P)H-dependent glycerol-3-phosphate dehydrogenase [Fulvivirgaceae bacterium BMA10]|uniref:Glycerol-3-phosphate dehydrogenase [NAD(P)+] n=1 Tax=Splendidivirga corallicola TaxID=3051826 RepID=A0ABT8KKB3_9BACT|nr:NAD(P)H-dependent glycerol-3-phosphate dehydrogenase [Fulvivirgaceae bacterium BMA10]